MVHRWPCKSTGTDMRSHSLWENQWRRTGQTNSKTTGESFAETTCCQQWAGLKSCQEPEEPAVPTEGLATQQGTKATRSCASPGLPLDSQEAEVMPVMPVPDIIHVPWHSLDILRFVMTWYDLFVVKAAGYDIVKTPPEAVKDVVMIDRVPWHLWFMLSSVSTGQRLSFFTLTDCF